MRSWYSKEKQPGLRLTVWRICKSSTRKISIGPIIKIRIEFKVWNSSMRSLKNVIIDDI